jgi:hypothetical protein
MKTRQIRQVCLAPVVKSHTTVLRYLADLLTVA